MDTSGAPSLFVCGRRRQVRQFGGERKCVLYDAMRRNRLLVCMLNRCVADKLGAA